MDFPPQALDEFSHSVASLGQVFYIGNGVTYGNVFQQFIAPWRHASFFGITDAIRLQRSAWRVR